MPHAKAALFKGPQQPFEIREYPLLPPEKGTVRLDLIACGVCGTDVHIHDGRLPAAFPSIIGHEFVGRVRDIHSEDSKSSGIRAKDAVIVDIACPCGSCALCRSGDDANCLHMGVTNAGDPEQPPHFWGGYAEASFAPVENLIRIPDSLDPKTVSVCACAGPTALHAFELAHRANAGIESAGTAVVQGLGPVGFFAVAYLAAAGVPHIAVVTARENPRRAALAKRFGATDVYSLDRQDIEEITASVASSNGGMGADLVFEASGNPAAVPQGLAMLRNRGVYLIPGQYSNRGGITIEPQLITFRALHLIGSSQYSHRDVEEYLRFLQAHPHLWPVIDELVTEYPVGSVNDAFADIRAGRNIKTLLVPGSARAL